MKDIGFMGIVVPNRQSSSSEINTVLTKHGDCIMSRSGMHSSDKNCWLISLTIDKANAASSDIINDLKALNNIEVHSTFDSNNSLSN